MPKKMTGEDFLTKSYVKFGKKYDYSKTIYENRLSNVIIICKIHGEFLQTPRNHLLGICGCKMCMSRGSQLDTTFFLKKAQIIHGNSYDYSMVCYENWNKRVKIICSTHGIFEQTPNNHLKPNHCPQCSLIKKSTKFLKSKEQFVNESNVVHNHKYDYNKLVYTGRSNKITIICSKHGAFNQSASHHLKGHGCPKCGKTISKPESDFLNYLNIKIENRQVYLNIGKIHVDGINGNRIFEFLGDFWHGNLKKYNPSSINPITNKTFLDLHKETFTRFEKLSKLGYKVYFIWESDWNFWKKNPKTTFPIKKFNSAEPPS